MAKRKRYRYMPIDAAPGTKVALWKTDWGHQHDRDLLKELGIKKYQVCTVKQTDIHSCSTTLWLEEYPDHGFNTVNWATF